MVDAHGWEGKFPRGTIQRSFGLEKLSATVFEEWMDLATSTKLFDVVLSQRRHLETF